MVTYLVAMGNSKGIVKRLEIEIISAAKYLYYNYKDMCSTTIESIAYEKYISEEVSRVGPSGSKRRAPYIW